MKEKNLSVKHNLPIKLDSPRAWRTYTGGANLDLLHGRPAGVVSQFPEEWIISVVAARNAGREDIKDEGMSRLAANTDVTLKMLIESDPKLYLGSDHAAQYGAQPGVLVKLIDSAERLTMQVHPDRKKAGELFGSLYGKTECWHILDTFVSEDGPACVYIGFKPGITRDCLQRLFERQDVEGMLHCLHRIEVHKGDTILIEGGVPHAIGAGCFLAEIQEPTDYTIRIEQTTPSGLVIADEMCHQGLGFERMFECFAFDGLTEAEVRKRWFIGPVLQQDSTAGSVTELIGYQQTDFFSLQEIRAHQMLFVDCGVTFSGLYILEGQGTLHANGKKCRIEKAEQYFIPAGTKQLAIEPAPGSSVRALRFCGPVIKAE